MSKKGDDDRLKYTFFNEKHLSDYENRSLIESIFSYFKESGMESVGKTLKGQYFELKKQTLFPQPKMNLLKRWKSVLEYDREVSLLKETLEKIDNDVEESGDGIPFHSTSTYKKILRFGHSESIRSFAVHPNLPIVLTGGNDKKIVAWDTNESMVVREITDHTSAVTALAFQKKGEKFASANDRTFEIYIWEYMTFLRLRRIKMREHTNEITRICFGERYCVTSSLDGTVRSWNVLNDWEMNLCFEGTKVNGLDLSDSEDQIVVGDVEGNISVVNTNKESENETKNVTKHSGEVEFVKIIVGGDNEESEGELEELIVSGAQQDSEIVISSLSDGKVIRKINTESDKPKDGCFVGEDYIIVVFRDLKMRIYQVKDGELIKTIKIETTIATAEPIGVKYHNNELFLCDEKCVRIYSTK